MRTGNNAACAFGDMNSNNLPDLVCLGRVTFASRNLYIMENLGNGSFADPVNVNGFSRTKVLSLTDVDADGDTDMVVAGCVGSNSCGNRKLYVLRNRLVEQNNSLATPLTFTLADGLPNVRIVGGTNNGYLRRENGSWIVSPLADLATGRRLLPRPGNMDARGFIRIFSSALVDGERIYGASQFVSHAFVGSAFSDEKCWLFSDGSLVECPVEPAVTSTSSAAPLVTTSEPDNNESPAPQLSHVLF